LSFRLVWNPSSGSERLRTSRNDGAQNCATMKILHLLYDHTRNPWVGGGAAVRASELYRRLADRHEISVVCGKYPGASDYREGNVSVRFVGSARNNYVVSTFCYAAQAVRYLKAHAAEFDVIVEDFAPYNPVFSFHWRRDAVLQLHQREGVRHLKKYAVFGILFYLIEKWYHRFFVNVVTISEMNRKAFGLAASGVVIPNGFEPGLLEWATEEGDYMLCLGRLHIDQKGLDTLRDAFRTAGGRLVIAGRGKDEARVRSLFSDEVKAGSVDFAGFVSGHAKTDLLAKCLFMVAPSRYEGQPLTVVEAAACSKPVIVSDIPELRYAVDAGFGLSFRTGDASDLADKMNFLLQDGAVRREMGRKAREYARNFTWDRIAEEYENYLLGIAKEEAPGRG
jgi:glycogen(starch) synthase